jgi:Ala-tRNA(Pro) deacylase
LEKNEKRVSDVLEELLIDYEVIRHPPVFKCDELDTYMTGVGGAHCKNLFLRNKKGNRHFLVIMDESKSMNIKAFGKSIGVSNLSFASPDRMLKYLGVTSGSVSVFGLINDGDHEVEVYLDAAILRQTHVNFHPNINTATYHLTQSDLKKYLDWVGNKVEIIEFNKLKELL